MIDLIPTQEQQEVADSIATFLTDNLPVERHRTDRGRRGHSEHEPEIWSQLADLGCFGLSLAEDKGGIGLSMAEETLAFREYGRYMVSPAMLGTVLAGKIAAHAGKTDLVAALLSGKRRAGIGNDAGPNYSAGTLQLFDVRPEDLVVVWSEAGAQLYEASALGAVTKLECIDQSVSFGTVNAAKAKPIASVSAKEQPLPLIASVLSAAMLTGIIEGIRDMAVLQAQTRMQFGQVIGTFQAVKHKVADIGMAGELAWCETVYAALTLVESTPDAPFHADNAKMIAGTGALDSARANIQLHGGMGFTQELNAHLFLKRVHVLNEIGGTPRELQHRVLVLPKDA